MYEKRTKEIVMYEGIQVDVLWSPSHHLWQRARQLNVGERCLCEYATTWLQKVAYISYISSCISYISYISLFIDCRISQISPGPNPTS